MVRFIERLGYHAGHPFPHSLRLMCRGAPLAEVLWLRHARALSVRRRPVHYRRTPAAWNGARAGGSAQELHQQAGE